MATEQTQQQAQQPLPLDNSAQQPQSQQTAVQPQADNTPAVKKNNAPAKTKAVDKSLVIASINQLPQVLQPLSGCFNDAWGSFVKAYGDGAGQVMAREIDFAVQAMLANNHLIECATNYPLEFANALKNVALTGSTLNPVLKQGYLVPFKGKVQFMPSYMGLIDVLVNSGLVKKIEAHCVYKGDKFDIQYGTNGHLIHKPDPWGERSEKTVLGAYYYAVLIDGAEIFDQMNKAEVDLIKQRSPSVAKKKQSPWDSDYLEMMKKTLVRRAFKMIPKKGISDDKLRAIQGIFDYDEKAEQNWVEEQKKIAPKKDSFDEEDAEWEEVK
ncbi:MAG: recombinase RecT [Muribaculaceae bacterium]|nr:recombinase RecT [Muribaculaceae bacterium]